MNNLDVNDNVIVKREVLFRAIQLIGELPTGQLQFKVVAECVSQLQRAAQQPAFSSRPKANGEAETAVAE